MALPLLTRVADDDVAFALTRRSGTPASRIGTTTIDLSRLPDRWRAVLVAVRFLRLFAADGMELRGTARLLSTVLRRRFVARLALLVAGAIVLPLVAGPAGEQDWLLGGRAALAAGQLVALVGEIVGRYLFFVSAVPMHMGLIGATALFGLGTLALLELGTYWSSRWAPATVERTGVYSYRAALGLATDESAA